MYIYLYIHGTNGWVVYSMDGFRGRSTWKHAFSRDILVQCGNGEPIVREATVAAARCGVTGLCALSVMRSLGTSMISKHTSANGMGEPSIVWDATSGLRAQKLCCSTAWFRVASRTPANVPAAVSDRTAEVAHLPDKQLVMRPRRGSLWIKYFPGSRWLETTAWSHSWQINLCQTHIAQEKHHVNR